MVVKPDWIFNVSGSPPHIFDVENQDSLDLSPYGRTFHLHIEVHSSSPWMEEAFSFTQDNLKPLLLPYMEEPFSSMWELPLYDACPSVGTFQLHSDISRWNVASLHGGTFQPHVGIVIETSPFFFETMNV